MKTTTTDHLHDAINNTTASQTLNLFLKWHWQTKTGYNLYKIVCYMKFWLLLLEITIETTITQAYQSMSIRSWICGFPWITIGLIISYFTVSQFNFRSPFKISRALFHFFWVFWVKYENASEGHTISIISPCVTMQNLLKF